MPLGELWWNKHILFVSWLRHERRMHIQQTVHLALNSLLYISLVVSWMQKGKWWALCCRWLPATRMSDSKRWRVQKRDFEISRFLWKIRIFPNFTVTTGACIYKMLTYIVGWLRERQYSFYLFPPHWIWHPCGRQSSTTLCPSFALLHPRYH